MTKLRKEYWELIKKLKDENLDSRKGYHLKKVLDVLNEINDNKDYKHEHHSLSLENIKDTSNESTVYLKNCEICGVTYLTKEEDSVKCHKTCKKNY